MTLFSGKKFYVPSSIARSEELRTMLISNGAQLIEADTEENVDDNVICVVDSFGSGNVRIRISVGLQMYSTHS